MQEISVTVKMPQAKPETYSFTQIPLKIGRSPNCHLSICHESIPRELCTVWLENQGTIIRVEERPNLTNAIHFKNRPIKGGISGKQLKLTVGPMIFDFKTSKNRSLKTNKINDNKIKNIVRIGGLFFIVVCCIAFLFIPKNEPSMQNTFPSFPLSPFQQVNISVNSLKIDPIKANSIKAGSIKQANLLISRAEELLQRTDNEIANKIIATKNLFQAAQFLKLKAPQKSTLTKHKAASLKKQIDEAYKKELVSLKRFISIKNTKLAAISSAKLLEYLSDSNKITKKWLTNLSKKSSTQFLTKETTP